MLKKITESDINGLGVVGLADTPGLSATDMQEKFEEISKSAIIPKFNQLIDDLEALNIYQKVDSVEGKGLSTNDYTNEDKEALYSTKGKNDETVKIFGKSSINFGRKSDSVIGDKSTALGADNTASGNYSDAFGNGNVSSGLASHSEGANNISSGKYSHAEGNRNEATKDYSHAEGYETKATSLASHSEGQTTNASGTCSHAEGYLTKAFDFSHSEGDSTTASGIGSHAEGSETEASGLNSHSEGKLSVASGKYSHAEGSGTKAIGSNAHAEGSGTQAYGNYSHAEGSASKANGVNSHAEGGATVAAGECQHVQGKFNVEDTDGAYAHIVGGGTSDTDRKNIHTLDWNGNAVFSGNVTDGNGDSIALLKTESGHSLELNIDENYVMTISLLNKSGETISSKAIDFPVESMVVNASYSSGKLTLVLQNGNMVDVDVSAIVKGLVNESRTIAGIDLKDDITADELIAALGIDTIKEDVAQLKGDLDYLIKKDTINHIDKTNVDYYGWNVLLPIYLDKDVLYVIGWAFNNDDSWTSPPAALKIVDNVTDRNELQTIKTDYTQISSNGHKFTWTNDSGWYYIEICPTSQATERTYKYIMCVENSYLIENHIDWTTIRYSNYSIVYTSKSDESDHASISSISDKTKSRWYGKVHLSYGDSITEQAVWQNLFKEYLGTSSEIVKGFSGQALWNNCKIDRLTSILGSETFDFATVMFGTNDWGQSRPIGVNTDFNDNGEFTGSYKGSLNTFCKNITTLFPNKPIIMVTPPNGFEDYDYNDKAFSDNGRKNLLGFTIKDYAEAMKEVCALWGIPCFDFNSVCGWNYINKATYLTNDGNGTFIHPNSVGGNEYAYKLAKFCEMN